MSLDHFGYCQVFCWFGPALFQVFSRMLAGLGPSPPDLGLCFLL
jgi:hypothetical protein